MKIEKLKSGSYRIRKMYKGVAYSVVTDYKPTQKEATILLAQELEKAQSPKMHITFETAANKYIEMKSNVISPSTITGYTSIIHSLSKSFKKIIITDITSVDVQAEINRYAKGRSAKTVRNMHAFISAVLGSYTPNLQLNTTLPMYVKPKAYIPSDDDIRAILEKSRGSKYESALILASFGLRRSEICALTDDDIMDGEISITKALVQDKDKKWVVKQTKTENGTRIVKVPTEVTDRIKEVGLYEGYPGSILKYLNRAQDRLGIPRFPLHKFRHYYASICHYLGIPDNYIMLSGGWKTDNILKTVYRHALDDKSSEMDKISGDHLKSIVL